jgi:phosphotriesterase-related protein
MDLRNAAATNTKMTSMSVSVRGCAINLRVVPRAAAALVLAVLAAATLQPAGAAPPVRFRGIEIPDRSGVAMTVTGPLAPSELGMTLPHEHLFIDLAAPFGNPPDAPRLPGPATPQARATFEAPFTTADRGALLPNAFTANRDALVLDSVDDAVAELRLFRNTGGRTVVNVTTSVGRNPRGLVEAARRSGVNVVMGTGFYRTAWHPADLPSRSIDDLTADMVRELVRGDPETGVRAGIIGEIAAEDLRRTPEDSVEVRVLRAAARASRLTGAAITLHDQIGRPEKYHVALDILEADGADLSRVVAGHVTGLSVEFVESLLRRGVYVEFDTLGAPFFVNIKPLDTRPNLETLVELIRRGHVRRLLVSQDVCTKYQLRKHGGFGYTFIATNLVPYLRANGIGDEQIQTLLVTNPAEVLTFRAPRPLAGDAR